MINEMKKGDFSAKIVAWYREHHRDLPWRRTLDPYKIWLSEIILQQTRVLQGLPYYRKFIHHYPNIRSLAMAPEQEILRLWQGLGYYSRARNLRKCAQVVLAEHGARFPRTASKLTTLPGIGKYTAAAIASFSFDERIPAVDGNVYRVLARHFGIEECISSAEGKRVFEKLANDLMPPANPGIHNQAMMEFGALHCLPVNPKCDSCIFEKTCYASRRNLQTLLPVKAKPKKATRRYFYYVVISRGKKLLMKERKAGDIWTGLFDFPFHEDRRPVSMKKIPEILFSNCAQQARKKIKTRISLEFKHVLTHQVIRARFIEIQDVEKRNVSQSLLMGSRFYSIPEIARLPKPVLISRYFQEKGIL